MTALTRTGALRAILIGALCIFVLGLSALAPGKDYREAAIESDFADPHVVAMPDGWYYAYATQTWRSEAILNIQIARSRNLVDWEHVGDALPRKPAWASRTQKFWAPQIIYDDAIKKYFMYFAAEPDSGSGQCLAVAIADSPIGPFIDSGEPLLCGRFVQAIDPSPFDDPQTGRHFLYWGAGSVKVQELSADRLHFVPGSAPTNVLTSDWQVPYNAHIEGAWVTFRFGHYYLFYSGDRCCSNEAHNAVMVARADSPLGPFVRGKRVLIEANGHWIAPGHGMLVRDLDGNEWLAYHAIKWNVWAEPPKASAPRRARPLLFTPIEFSSGWPVLKLASTLSIRDSKAKKKESSRPSRGKVESSLNGSPQ